VNDFIHNFLNPQILARVWPQLMHGLGTTLLLSLLIVPAGLAGGLLVGMAQSAPSRLLRWAMVIYTDLFRSFPPLVLLVFVYYGLPFMGIDTDAFWSVILALTLNTASYFGEVFRAGIESIPRGQVEAARSTGLSARQAMASVIVP